MKKIYMFCILNVFIEFLNLAMEGGQPPLSPFPWWFEAFHTGSELTHSSWLPLFSSNRFFKFLNSSNRSFCYTGCGMMWNTSFSCFPYAIS